MSPRNKDQKREIQFTKKEQSQMVATIMVKEHLMYKQKLSVAQNILQISLLVQIGSTLMSQTKTMTIYSKSLKVLWKFLATKYSRCLQCAKLSGCKCFCVSQNPSQHVQTVERTSTNVVQMINDT